jgi:hypothetical protein
VTRRILIAFALTFAAPLVAGAQSSATRAPAGCTYETCALRVEARFWMPSRLLRGRDGVEIGKLGAFGGGVDTLLAGPDSAAAHARRYVTATRRANGLALLGAVAYVVALARTDNLLDADPTTAGIALTGLGLSIASIPFALHAQRSLSRSVWFYDAQFAK